MAGTPALTRRLSRQVFHGMMVLMFLPTTYVDPAFCALALGTVLSIFLLLDLFRHATAIVCDLNEGFTCIFYKQVDTT